MNGMEWNHEALNRSSQNSETNVYRRVHKTHRYTESLPSLVTPDRLPESPIHLKMCAPVIPPSILANVRPRKDEIPFIEESISQNRVQNSSSSDMNQRILSILRQKSKSQAIQHDFQRKSERQRLDVAASKGLTSKLTARKLKHYDEPTTRLEVHLSMHLQSNNISRISESQIRGEGFGLGDPRERQSIAEVYRMRSLKAEMPPLFGRQSVPRDSTCAGSGEHDSSGVITNTLNSPLFVKSRYTPKKSILRVKYHDAPGMEQQTKLDYIEEQIIRSTGDSTVRDSRFKSNSSTKLIPQDDTIEEWRDSQLASQSQVLLTQNSQRPKSRRLKNPEIEMFKSYRSQMETIRMKIMSRKSSELNYKVPQGVLIEPTDFNQFYKTVSGNRLYKSQHLANKLRANLQPKGDETPNASLRRRMTSKLLDINPGLHMASSQMRKLPDFVDDDGGSSSAFTSEQVSPTAVRSRKQPLVSSRRQSPSKPNQKPKIKQFDLEGRQRKPRDEPISPTKVTIEGAESSSQPKSPGHERFEPSLASKSPKRRGSEIQLIKEFASGFLGFANLVDAAQKHKRNSMLIPSSFRLQSEEDPDKVVFHMRPKMLIIDNINPLKRMLKFSQPVGLMHYETENRTRYSSYWMKLIYQMLQSFDLSEQPAKLGYYSLYEPQAQSLKSKEDLDRGPRKMMSKLTLDFQDDNNTLNPSAAQSSAEDPLSMFSNKQRKNLGHLIRIESKIGQDLYHQGLDMQRNYVELKEQVSGRNYQYASNRGEHPKPQTPVEGVGSNDPATFFVYKEQLMAAGKQPVSAESAEFRRTCAEMEAAMGTTEAAKDSSGLAGLARIALFTEKLSGVQSAPEAILGGAQFSLSEFPRSKDLASPKAKPLAFFAASKTFNLIPPQINIIS